MLTLTREEIEKRIMYLESRLESSHGESIGYIFSNLNFSTELLALYEGVEFWGVSYSVTSHYDEEGAFYRAYVNGERISQLFYTSHLEELEGDIQSYIVLSYCPICSSKFSHMTIYGMNHSPYHGICYLAHCSQCDLALVSLPEEGEED